MDPESNREEIPLSMDNAIDPNASKEVAMTSLDWCARSRHVTLLKAVLSAHFSDALISDMRRECIRVLRNAVTSGCRETLVSLLQHVDDEFLRQRHDVNDDVREERTRLEILLGVAVELGHRDIAEILLSKGANPNCCYRQKPLLHLSLGLGFHSVAFFLAEHGADVNMTDSNGETPLFSALSSSSSRADSMIEELIRRGADVQHRSATGRQALHAAAGACRWSAVPRLAEAGGDAGARDAVAGDTPLHLACARCCPRTVLSLVRHGARVNAANHRQHTPLRRLLQHATSASRDFHLLSRLRLARSLMAVGFRLQPDPPPHTPGGTTATTLPMSAFRDDTVLSAKLRVVRRAQGAAVIEHSHPTSRCNTAETSRLQNARSTEMEEPNDSASRQTGKDKVEGGGQTGRDKVEGGGQTGRDKVEGGGQTGRDKVEGGGQTGRDKVEGGGQTGRDKVEGGRQTGRDKVEGGGQTGRDKVEGGGQTGRDKVEGGGQTGRDKVEGGGQTGRDKVEGGGQTGRDKVEGGGQTGRDKVEGGGQTGRDKVEGGGQTGRDKVLDVVRSLQAEKGGALDGVAALQHLCRMSVRCSLPTRAFQQRVAQLELSAHLKDYLCFLPSFIDDIV